MTSKTDPEYGKGEVIVTEEDSFSPALRLVRAKLKEAITQQSFEIPLLPHIAAQVLQMANDPKAGLSDLEKLVKQDPVIAAKIIQVSNSPFYRAISTIVSLRDAMGRIGLKMMKDIIFSLSIRGKVFQAKGFERELEKIWMHSISCAAIAQLIAKRLGVDSEYAFLSGLLHDIGKVVLIQTIAKIEEDERRKKAEEAKKLFKPFDPATFKIESLHEAFIPVVYKEFHCDVGALVALKWKLPELIAETLRFHHDYTKAKDVRGITTVVYLANRLCHHFGYGHDEAPIDFMQEKGFFDLSFSPDQVKKMIEEIPEKVSGLASAF